MSEKIKQEPTMDEILDAMMDRWDARQESKALKIAEEKERAELQEKADKYDELVKKAEEKKTWEKDGCSEKKDLYQLHPGSAQN